MAKRKAIVRKLPAVETLGSTTVICSDKTGTLTRNEMTVCELWTFLNAIQVSGAGYNKIGSFFSSGSEIDTLSVDVSDLLQSAVLCSDATIVSDGQNFDVSGDPTEISIVVAAAKAGLETDKLRRENPRTDVIPFDSGQQFMATLHSNGQLIIKGAPEVVMERCKLLSVNSEYERITAQIDSFGARGMRILAVAHKQFESSETDLDLSHTSAGFEFLGLIAIMDPPRAEVFEAIRKCHRAGIIVKMITGDHKETARSIGLELAISTDGKVLTGKELSVLSDQELSLAATSVNIFARVAPEHKLKLVKALQSSNHVVAMTGDGVNDAPSLKQASIGVAMGITGTSVSKEAADIVLADDNFASISAAVEEGRRVYDNLLKSLAFLLPTNLGLALILIYGIMFFPFNPATQELLLPMLPTQLLWINLVAAISLALPLAFEVKEPNIMLRPPRKPSAPLFSNFIIFRVVFVSILMTFGTISLFNFEYFSAIENDMAANQALAKAQTIAVTFVIIFQVFYMLNCRSLKDSLFKIGWWSNKFIFLGMATILALQALFIYTPFLQTIFRTAPLDLNDIAISVLAGFLIFPIIGIEKSISKRFFKE
jgi:Ca2+-transporting ATPase